MNYCYFLHPNLFFAELLQKNSERGIIYKVFDSIYCDKGCEKMKTKNNAIEFYRIIATLIICVHHFKPTGGLHIFTNGYLMVEFFFILSGLFLAQKFDCESSHSGSKYFFGRLKRLYPEYILAAVIAIASYSFVGKFDVSKSISEILMVQNIGMFFGGYNYPCWYISVLVFAGIILYEALKYGKDLFVKVIAPVVVLGGYTYIIHGMENDAGFIWSTQGCIHVQLLRCICGMLTGIIIYHISKFDFVFKIKKWIWTLLEIICIAVIAIGITTYILKIQIIVLGIIGLVFITYSQCGYIGSKILNFNGVSYVSRYSYSLYVNHGILANVFDVMNRNGYLNIGKAEIPVYMLALIVYSVITHNVISYISKKITEKTNK